MTDLPTVMIETIGTAETETTTEIITEIAETETIETAEIETEITETAGTGIEIAETETGMEGTEREAVVGIGDCGCKANEKKQKVLHCWMV